MNVKYFQALADIRNRYERFFLQREFFNEKYLDLSGKEINKKLSGHYELVTEDEDIVKEEYLCLCYLINLKHGFVMNRSYYAEEKVLKKPTIECVQRTLNRHLEFLDNYLNCNAENYRTYDLKNVTKEYLACRHYLFKFSLPAWVEKLPAQLTSLEDKYKNLEEEDELPIPKI